MPSIGHNSCNSFPLNPLLKFRRKILHRQNLTTNQAISEIDVQGNIRQVFFLDQMNNRPWNERLWKKASNNDNDCVYKRRLPIIKNKNLVYDCAAIIFPLL